MENKPCNRCGKESISSIMSWFTNELICGNCSRTESEIRLRLPNRGIEFEGCGFVPDIEIPESETIQSDLQGPPNF